MAGNSLDAAKRLRESGHIRSCLSRAYYSAYAAVTGELLAVGLTVGSRGRPNPDYLQLATMAAHNLSRLDEPGRRRIAKAVRLLRRLREAADYDPDSELETSDAILALQRASDVQRLIER